MNKKLVFIGDIHGRWLALERILEELGIVQFRGVWENFNNYEVCFLGDISDHGEGNNKSSLETLRLVKVLNNTFDFTVLMSNHLDKLKRWALGNKVKLTHGLDYTVKEIEQNFIDKKFNKNQIHTWKNNLINWLNSLPLYKTFKEGDKTYVAAHAYMDDYLFKSTAYPHFCETTKEYDWFRQQCIYGRKQKDIITGESIRREWWNEKGYDLEHFQDNHYIVGHYHITKSGYNYNIIDTNENAVVYYVPSENLIKEVSNE